MTNPVPQDAEGGQKNPDHCMVIGGGIAGLAAAWNLVRNERCRPARLTLIESREELGGVIKSVKEDGYLFETAAQGVLASRAAFQETVSALQLEDTAIFGDPKLKRFLIRGEKLLAISPLPISWVLRGLLSAQGLLRLFLEPFQPKSLQNVTESIFDFGRRRFGEEFSTRFLIPMATGIWGGGARRILMRHAFPRLVELESEYGSILGGLIRSLLRKRNVKNTDRHRNSKQKTKKWKGLVSFPDGLSGWIHAMEKDLQAQAKHSGVHFEILTQEPVLACNLTHAVSSAAPQQPQPWVIKTPTREIPCDALFHAVPPWKSQIDYSFDEFCTSRWRKIQTLPRHGLVVVGIGGVDPLNPPPEGFGALAPEESKALLGVLFVHSISPGHAPDGHFLYRVMLGGDRAPQFVEQSESECLQVAEHELQKLGLLAPSAKIEFRKVVRWPDAIPLLDAAHDERIQALHEIEHALPGLYFCGNYLGGVGVHNCLESAQAAVENYAHNRHRIDLLRSTPRSEPS